MKRIPSVTHVTFSSAQTKKKIMSVPDQNPLDHSPLQAPDMPNPDMPNMVSADSPGWLHSNIRSCVLLALGLVVCYMALRGDKEAIAAVLATFATLAGSTWGSRDALKVPGRDN